MTGWQMLFYKELLRFWKVAFQTVVAPVVTSMLYLLIFGHVLENRLQVYGQLSYTAFLVPGLVMMSILQNAFANSASSLVQSKIMGNLVFIQLTPLSHWAWFTAYVGSSVVRALVVGLGFSSSRSSTPSRGSWRRCGAWRLPCWARGCSGRSVWWPVCGPTSSTTWPPSRISSSCP